MIKIRLYKEKTIMKEKEDTTCLKMCVNNNNNRYIKSCYDMIFKTCSNNFPIFFGQMVQHVHQFGTVGRVIWQHQVDNTV